MAELDHQGKVFQWLVPHAAPWEWLVLQFESFPGEAFPFQEIWNSPKTIYTCFCCYARFSDLLTTEVEKKVIQQHDAKLNFCIFTESLLLNHFSQNPIRIHTKCVTQGTAVENNSSTPIMKGGKASPPLTLQVVSITHWFQPVPQNLIVSQLKKPMPRD